MTTEQSTSGLAETMEAVFADIVGTPSPESKGDPAVVWYLKALQRLDKRRNDAHLAWDAMFEEIQRWINVQETQIAAQQEWLDEQMLPTAEAVTRAKIAYSDKKSFEWPYGVCSFKKQQDHYEWPDDETELVEWCLENDVNCLVKTSIDKLSIKKHIRDTGEVPPGVTITPGVEKFYVKPAPLALPGEQPKLLGLKG